MKRNTNHLRRSWLVLAAAAVSLPTVALASTTRNWIAGSSNWNTPGNWNPTGVPAAGDSVNIINNDSSSRVITYNYSGMPVTLVGMLLSDTGGGSDTLLINVTGS